MSDFTRGAQRRIARTVIAHERSPQSRAAKQGRRPQILSGHVKFAKLDADLNAGSSCTASIWVGDPLADTGDNQTVYDWFLETGYKLESGAKVMLTLMSGKWYVTMSDTCPVAQ